MRQESQNGLVRYISKVCLEFFAEFNERTPLAAYRHIKCPVLLLQGEHTHLPMRMIARRLSKVMKSASLQTVYGASHMGPFTHAAVVSVMMANHIAAAEDRVPRGDHAVSEDSTRLRDETRQQRHPHAANELRGSADRRMTMYNFTDPRLRPSS